MLPHTQTIDEIVVDRDGVPVYERMDNSMQCCIAAIFNLKLEEVPNFHETPITDQASFDLYWAKLREFLDPMGIYPIALQFPVEVGEKWFPMLEGYHIRVGQNKEGHVHFCVGYKEKIYHDPHISREGIKPLGSPLYQYWDTIVFGKKV